MKRKYHLISNTHWDREWRFPFQRNRQMLVQMIDSVLDILVKEPKYRAFHLDSQSIVLDDYLQIRPDKKSLIAKLVKAKRLFIGPWYILPDEFLVGGENLIRNLLLGHKTCKLFGRVSKVGYSPFSWGQISQLPQLYAGFGIDVIMFYRGINSLDSPKAEFIWVGADGTKTISSRFSTLPRYNFYFYIYRPVVHNEFPFDVEYKWSKGGTPFHFADKDLSNEDYFIPNPADYYFKENIVPQVNKIIEDQANDFTTPNVIWMEGHDSSGPNIKTVRIVDDIKKMMPEVNVIHSTLECYIDDLKREADYSKLPVVKGERRSAQFDRRSGNLYGHVTSSRMYLKQKNFEAEKWLQFFAEPFNSISGILGKNINDEYLNIAWNFIIQNSAHDSIGGCSLDEIHDDMMNRYKQAIEISKGVFDSAIKYLILQTNTSLFSDVIKRHEQPVNKQTQPNGYLSNDENIYLTAFNPSFSSRNEIIEAHIDIPDEFDKGSFVIIDDNGNEIDYQLIKVKKHEPVLEQLIDRPMYFKMTKYKCLLNLKNLPSFGLKTFKIIPLVNVEAINKNSNSSIEPIGKNNSILNEKTLSLENRFVKVKVNKDGTFNITDKIGKNNYKNLGYFYDEGEGGHAWVHTPIEPFISTLNSNPEIKPGKHGHLVSSIKVSHKIRIPYSRLKNESDEEMKFVELPIKMKIILKADSPKVFLSIKINNKAESHRLRIMFPTELKAEYSYAEGQFDVVARPIKRPDTKDWIEQPQYDYPFHHFVSLPEKERGISFFGNGLKEYEVLEDKQQTLALTLIKAFEYIIAPSSQQDYSKKKGSQCTGKAKFSIVLFPHSKSWEKTEVYNEALNFQNSISLVQHGTTYGYLPLSQSFIKLKSGKIIFSAFKKADNNKGFILRLYNPYSKAIDETVMLNFKVKEVSETTLEEIPIEKLSLMRKDNLAYITTKFQAKKIKTFLLITD